MTSFFFESRNVIPVYDIKLQNSDLTPSSINITFDSFSYSVIKIAFEDSLTLTWVMSIVKLMRL